MEQLRLATVLRLRSDKLLDRSFYGAHGNSLAKNWTIARHDAISLLCLLKRRRGRTYDGLLI